MFTTYNVFHNIISYVRSFNTLNMYGQSVGLVSRSVEGSRSAHWTNPYLKIGAR